MRGQNAKYINSIIPHKAHSIKGKGTTIPLNEISARVGALLCCQVSLALAASVGVKTAPEWVSYVIAELPGIH